MKEYWEIAKIISTIDPDTMNKIADGETDYWLLNNTKERAKGRKRANYHLQKFGISFEEYLFYKSN